MFGGIGVLRLIGGLAAALVAIMGPYVPLIATLAVLTALLIALNVVEVWWVSSGRPLLLLRTGRGAMPDTGYSTSAPAR